MTARARLRSLGASAVLVLAATGLLASAASAAPPSVTITRPGDGQVLAVSAFTVEAIASMSDGVVVGKTRVTVGPAPDSVSKQVPQSAEFDAADNKEQRISYAVEVEYNGKYRATVTATGRDNTLLVPDDRLEPATATRDFFVAAPPAPPGNVRPVIDKDSRYVTLNWSANTEKDLLFYVVQRARGDGAYSSLGKTDGPGDTSIVDTTTAEAGGDYRYQVIAVRRGAKAGEGVNSDPSPAARASVPPPPGPSTTVSATTTGSTTPTGGAEAAGGSSGPSGATATTLSPNSPGALKKSGTIDLSGFTAIQSQARRSAPRPVEADPGFTETLPFGTSDTTRLVGDEQAGAEAKATGGDSAVRELGAQDASNDRQRSAAFLAAGLLATVLLMHLLWIKGEVQREPLEVLVPE